MIMSIVLDFIWEKKQRTQLLESQLCLVDNQGNRFRKIVSEHVVTS